ncbi:hypothetical protein FOE78_08265 [Microlunatus elymi]|uniref:Beta-galactosidase n=1 Tax=Microlunatus elymi TaxID=2596828 RepID=A0A516PXJ7_9ACTN|nr:hypothetical protein [Microlunatus elymi]QDP95893.1 hypothetical protein FOE78_08265 [Microlunatus elymi]
MPDTPASAGDKGGHPRLSRRSLLAGAGGVALLAGTGAPAADASGDSRPSASSRWPGPAPYRFRLPTGVTLRDVDGGPNYFDRFSPEFPAAGTFMIGHWAVVGIGSQADLDRHRGRVNTFVEDAYNPDWHDFDTAGFYGVGSHDQDVGSLVTDEPDQWAGPGYGAWTGKSGFVDGVCKSGKLDCGYTVVDTLLSRDRSKRFRYIGYSKVFSMMSGDELMHEWARRADVMGSDVYWFTEKILDVPYWGASKIVLGPEHGDQALTEAQIRQASNYGRLIKYTRGHIGVDKPVWSVHEIAAGPTPEQLRAGVWSAIVNGAQGIVYFTHNFIEEGGYANSFDDPRYAAHERMARRIYTEVQDHAAALHGPEAVGLVSSSGSVDVLAKWNRGRPTLFCHERDQKSQRVTFTLAGAPTGLVSVYGENRHVIMTGGRFTDTFADGNTVHIYQL